MGNIETSKIEQKRKYPTDTDEIKNLISERFKDLKAAQDEKTTLYKIGQNTGLKEPDYDHDQSEITHSAISTLSKLQNGKSLPKLPTLLDLCNIFDCDIDYFLSKNLNARTKDNQFIMDETGLSQAAIDTLRRINTSTDDLETNNKLSFISFFITNPKFNLLFSRIFEYGMMKKLIESNDHVKNHDQLFQLYINYRRNLGIFNGERESRSTFIKCLCDSLSINSQLVDAFEKEFHHLNLPDKLDYLYEALTAEMFFSDPETKSDPEWMTMDEAEILNEKIRLLIGFYEYEEDLAYEFELPLIKSEIQDLMFSSLNQYFDSFGIR